MQAAALSKWLAATPLSRTIQETGWLIPTLQTIHLIAIAVLFASMVLVDLRLWRLFEASVPLKDVAYRFIPVLWPVLLVLATSGALLIVAEPKRSLLNETFYIKMVLLAAAILVTAFIKGSLAFDANFWDRTMSRRMAGNVIGAASFAIWCGIIVAGRWIAYTAT